MPTNIYNLKPAYTLKGEDIHWCKDTMYHISKRLYIQNYSAFHRVESYLRQHPVNWVWGVTWPVSPWVHPVFLFVYWNFPSAYKYGVFWILTAELQTPHDPFVPLQLSSDLSLPHTNVSNDMFPSWASFTDSVLSPWQHCLFLRRHSINIYRRNLLLYLHYFSKMILSKVTSQSPNPLGIWRCLFFWTFFHLMMLFLKTFCAQHFLY